MRKIADMISIILAVCFLGIFAGNVKCEAKGKIDMRFSIYDDFSVTNAEGKKFVYHRFYKLGGNMKIYDKRMYSSAIDATIDDSSRFTYKSKRKKNDIRLMDDDTYVAVSATKASSIIIDYARNTSNVKINGTGIDFDVMTDMSIDENHLVFVDGKGTNAEVLSAKGKIVVKNVAGIASFEISNMKTGKDRDFHFLPTSAKVTFSNLTGKSIKVRGGILLDGNISKKAGRLCVAPVSANQMVLGFNRVKGAKGYYIYRYDESSQNYKQIGKLKGNKSTLFQDSDVQRNTVYRYKVSSYKGKKDKTKESKKSYEVSAVTASDTLSNATKVTLNKSGRIKLKKGKTLKLKAKVTGEKGKKLFSKDIRWCSLNKKRAVVDKNGRVKALKKGTCKIYAKVHNGKNSMAIIIRVV